MSTRKPEFIVAIGGSAGFLAPLLSFFDYTINDRVSYVILCHLPTDTLSLLKEIVQWHSKLEVLTGTDNMPVENNKVYVLPPGYYMTIKDGILHLQDRKKSTRNCAIDIFMESLAADFGERSIGVILSGSGVNGLKGAACVKEAGGIVLTQTPSSCEFDAMPLNIIESGNSDYVLLPQEMPRTILQYVANYLRKLKDGVSF